MARILGFATVVVMMCPADAFSVSGMRRTVGSARASMLNMKDVLIVGGTRFSGLYLWEELHNRGHSVTLYNRGKTALKKIPSESDEAFEKRKAATKYVKGDRKDIADMKAKLGGLKFDVVYDMGGREAGDTEPLIELFGNKVEHFIYMSSAGVYKKSLTMPHVCALHTDAPTAADEQAAPPQHVRMAQHGHAGTLLTLLSSLPLSLAARLLLLVRSAMLARSALLCSAGVLRSRWTPNLL